MSVWIVYSCVACCEIVQHCTCNIHYCQQCHKVVNYDIQCNSVSIATSYAVVQPFYSVSFFSFHLHRVVKLSSPYLNVLIIVGVILFYVDVILFGVDERTASRCTVNASAIKRMHRQ